MANRLKEQEKNEKIIRGLTKLPENRKCINCGSLGPQYVCTSFSIFICTTCSGIHREFTHRVKSISMATFTPTEVAALQAGGNQRAREIYFREWDSTRQSLPDASNPERLRDFIKSVYVEKRYSGDRRGRLSDADDDIRKPDRFKSSQSPAYEDRDDRRSNNNRPGSRGSDRGFDEKMSPARFDERDRYDSKGYQDDRDRRYNDRDRRFDDRERRYEERDRYYEDRERPRFDERDRRYDDRDRRGDDRDRRGEDRDRRGEDRDRRGDDRERRYESEEQRRWDDRESRSNRRFSDDLDKRSTRPALYRGGETPPLRSVRDILGDDVPKLRVEDGSRPNGRVEDGGSPLSVSSSQGEPPGRVRSFKSIDAPVNGTTKVAANPQPALSDSLIDFSVDSEPPKPAAQTTTATTTFDPFGTVNEPGKANTTFDPFATAETKAPFVASTATTAFDPFATGEQSSSVASSTSGWASFDLSPPKPAQTPAESFLQQPATQGKVSDMHPSQQHSGLNGWPAQLQTSQTTQGPWNSSASASLPQQLHQVQSQQQPPAPADNGQQSLQRRQIPEDLFAAPNFGGMHMMRPPFPFQQVPPGYGAPMPMPGHVPSYMQPPKPKSNPFDLSGDQNPTTFPSMAPLHSALPSFNVGPLSSPAPGLGGPAPQWSQPGMGRPSVAPPASYPPSVMPGGGFNQQQMPPHMIPHFTQSQFASTPNPGPFTNGQFAFAGMHSSAMQPAEGGGGGGGGFGGGNPFG